MVSPSRKRQAARYVVEQGKCSARRACSLFKIHRSTYGYQRQEPQEPELRLRKRLRSLSWNNPRYGYRRIWALLCREGWQVSKKKVQRIRRAEGLGVKPAKAKRRRQGTSTGLPTKATYTNHVWSWDFIHDRTDSGASVKTLSLLDEYTRECLLLHPKRKLTSKEVIEAVSEVIAWRGAPDHLRSDNGSEFIAKEVQQWLADHKIKTIYIDPGSPWQNGCVESFHGSLRDECLNREWLLNMTEAKVVLEDYRREYNTYRPHSSLNYLTPQEFSNSQGSVPLRTMSFTPQSLDKQPKPLMINRNTNILSGPN